MIPAFTKYRSAAPSGYWYDSLFLSGDIGMVFDADRLATVFQDTGHATPCTAAGQSVNAMQDIKNGGYIAANYGSATLAYDSARSKYKVDIDASCNFNGVGIVPSALGGDSSYTLIVAGSFPNTPFGPIYIGPSYPTNPGTRNAVFIGNLNDPTLRLDFLQFGTSSGVSATSGAAVGTGVVIGVKKPLSAGYHNLSVYDLVGTQTANNSLVACNITTLNFDLGRALGAGSIYSLVILNRAITSTEIAYVRANALP